MTHPREPAGPRHPLDAIFRARSVAVVGASADARKLNAAPLAILRMTGFPGSIYPVNPKYDSIEGTICYPDLGSLPEAPDVALILVPAADVPEVLDQCGRKGTRAAVVVSSGFEEVGDSGPLVDAVRATCERHRIALVGPNCEGVWSVRSKVLLTFGSAARREQLSHSPVAMLSQSGSMAGAVARQLQDSGFGCAYVVSVGNETVTGLLDYLDYLVDQDDVRVILLFLEGLQRGERLVRLAERARARGMVIVALKSGSSTAGREAVASHTGKMTTSHAIYRDIFAQAGILQVESLVDLIEAAQILSSLPLPPRGDRNAGVGVFSIPGGTRALTADLCESHDVPLAKFDGDTVAALQAVLPSFGVPVNPTDVTGQMLSQPELFERVLKIIARDANTTSLLVQLANRGPTDAVRYQAIIADAARARKLPVVLSFLGDSLPAPERLAFARQGMACARDPADAVRYLHWLYAAASRADRPFVEAPQPLRTRARGERLPSSWAGAMQFLDEAGIAAPRWKILQPGASSTLAASDLRFPVALKVLPEHADHKTEKGLLRLDLLDADAIEHAATALRRALGDDQAPLLIQEMAPAGVECVVAITRDPDFGSIVAIGSGGVFVELIRDIGYLSLPVFAADVERLIDRLALSRLLAGFRGAPPADRRSLVAAVLGIGRAIELRRGELDEVEINPLLVLPQGHGSLAVDVLMKPRSEPTIEVTDEVAARVGA